MLRGRDSRSEPGHNAPVLTELGRKARTHARKIQNLSPPQQHRYRYKATESNQDYLSTTARGHFQTVYNSMSEDKKDLSKQAIKKAKTEEGAAAPSGDLLLETAMTITVSHRLVQELDPFSLFQMRCTCCLFKRVTIGCRNLCRASCQWHAGNRCCFHGW